MYLTFLKRIVVFIGLTVLTQVGGIVYLFYILLKRLIEHRLNKSLKWPVRLSFFSCLYLMSTFVIIPPIAKQFGRVPMPYFATNKAPVQPLTVLTVLLNRHYVKPPLKKQILAITKPLQQSLDNKPILINYLDANFPFVDGFPLLPHLSHDDGEKIDLAFVYKDAQTGKILNDSPSWIGYGVNEAPKKGEVNQPAICAKKGHWQYSILETITPQWKKEKLVVHEQATKRLLQLLVQRKTVKKIFLEPHLTTRWGLQGYDKIRYHGCHAVRHDDHIHVQL
ncbi:MAG: hypothetical protein AAGJ18_21195 [Bacteroidota bacterium]